MSNIVNLNKAHKKRKARADTGSSARALNPVSCPNFAGFVVIVMCNLF
jgi:hypothetical protein